MKVQSNMNKFRPLSEAAFVASALSCCVMLYATDEPKSKVLGKGYFDNNLKYLNDNTLVIFASGVGSNKPETFTGFLTIEARKPTKKDPATQTINIKGVSQAGKGSVKIDLSAVEGRLKAIEGAAENQVDLSPIEKRLKALEENNHEPVDFTPFAERLDALEAAQNEKPDLADREAERDALAGDAEVEVISEVQE